MTLTTRQIRRLKAFLADRTEQQLDDAYSDREPTPPDPLETPAWAGWLAWAGLAATLMSVGAAIMWGLS